MEYSVKVSFNEEMRRFTCQGSSFRNLYDQIVGLLGIEKNVELVVRYTDEDGDLITMASDMELKAAVAPGKLLRLIVTRKNDAASVTPVKTVAPAPAPTLTPVPVPAPVSSPVAPEASSSPFSGVDTFPRPGMWKREWHGRKSDPNWKEMKAQKWAARRLAREEAKKERVLPDAQGPHSELGGRGRGCDSKGPKFIARHVKDVTIADGTEIPANTPFVKTWRIRNDGPAWPAGCVLLYVSRNGDSMGGPQSVPVPFEGSVPENQEVDISVPLVAPASPGRYVGFWRLCSPEGRKFGQRIWVSIVVPSASSDESPPTVVPEKYEELVDIILGMGFEVKKRWILRLLQKHDGSVDKVAEILAKRGKAFSHKRKEQTCE